MERRKYITSRLAIVFAFFAGSYANWLLDGAVIALLLVACPLWLILWSVIDYGQWRRFGTWRRGSR